jgi:diguanylate cyclase (GGDEF)-like protein
MRRSAAFALAGGVLALGAPAGLLVLRSFLEGDVSWRFWSRDVLEDPALYAYLTISTAIAFSLFGAFTGRQADALSRLSRVDHLTGLANRRAIEDSTRLEHSRARRQDQTLAFFIIDLDQLKAINDQKGHRDGDAAIRAVALAMTSSARAADICARWGGDEFAILATATDAEQSRSLAERIRAEVQASSAGVTVSIGVAVLRPRASAETIESMIMRADGALYRAKSAGRNRVEVDMSPGAGRVSDEGGRRNA